MDYSTYQNDIFNWVITSQLPGYKHSLITQAVAGSGKTFTLKTAILDYLQLPESQVCSVAFNKDIATVLGQKLVGKATVKTYHALGLSGITKSLGRVNVDLYKIDNILPNVLDKYSWKWAYSTIKRLVGICKNSLLPVDISDEMLMTISYHFGLDINGSSNVICDAVRDVMKKSLDMQRVIDFDDMISFPHYLNLPMPTWGFLGVDELQDTNAAQADLVKRSIDKNTILVGIGDKKQCVIADTSILCYNGDTMLAQNINREHKLLSAYGSGSVHPSNIVNQYSRQVENLPVIKITTKTGKSLTTTPEHVYFADFVNSKSEDLYYTYLMKKGNWWRVGMAGYYRSVNDKVIPGFRGRGNQEQADAMWILEVSNSQNEARYWEEFYATKYGLPTWLFRVSGRGYKLAYDDVYITKLFSSIDTEERALQILKDKQYDINRPHYAPKAMSKRDRRNFSIVLCGSNPSKSVFPQHRFSISGSNDDDKAILESAGIVTRSTKKLKTGKGWRVETSYSDIKDVYNVLDKITAVLPVNLIEKGNFANDGIQALRFMPASQVLVGMSVFIHTDNGIELDDVVNVEHLQYSGSVYDFDIDRVHNYIANGIVVHNSIYAFRGADTDAMDKFQSQFNCDTLPLSICYRCPQSVVELVNAEFPDLEFYGKPDNSYGDVNTRSINKVDFVENDLILCRTNAPMVKECYSLIRRGVKAVIKGRDIGKGLIALVKKMKANDLNSCLNKLSDYKSNEMYKLADRPGLAAAVEDRCETIFALSDGCNSIEELTGRIDTIFSDDTSSITFSTVHRAKGLEADHVYILKPELMPHPSAKQSWEREQESNLRYVAITRAKEELTFLTD